MILQLHKYVETDSRVSTALPLTFLGLAASIMVLASLACCCTAKGKVPLLYLVSINKHLICVNKQLTFGNKHFKSKQLQFCKQTVQFCKLTNYK